MPVSIVARRRVLRQVPLLGGLALLVSACATHVRSTGTYGAVATGAPLQRPEIVLVEEFAVDPSEVHLDTSLRARLTRGLEGTQPDTRRAQEAARVRGVAAATLVGRIQAMGLPAAVVAIGTTPHERAVLVRGQVVDIDEGNRTRRTLIGFGAGKSVVGADVQVYYAAPGQRPALLQTFEADVDSGRMPGMATTMGVGAAAGHLATSAAVSGGLHVASENRKADPEDQAKKLGNCVADALGAVFRREGWIATTGG
ncbi:conserved exported protein of unknown function [Rhodovastum atsumiense]|uniref:DUF4410 domain-containing protein n=1 Tax=Rhodovastum atsumiense TaxID=504468 RepID=A0A5M6IW83_9PROT|nr:DUF4410 domain-containing protein [Rhodovastum atsumiense]KAA5612593.1 DUF4410 domain-containing protein [Rhodovastum atsumiense]CAH2601309.1 conserved exported protein of unknown function [Rhodovastum atsumiense]